jgi:predicted dehydrogenase
MPTSVGIARIAPRYRRPMRIGLLAAAQITPLAVVEPVARIDGVEMGAVAARSRERALAAADGWGVERAVGSYDELVELADLDAIYIATPAALHHRWTLAALAAGKHVLCEKPIASNAGEARDMVTAADAAGLVLMEAFHWRYHPLVGQMRSVLDSDRLGTIERVEATFEIPDGDIPRDDIRWDLTIGGGALMDLGCYPVHWARWAVGSEPTVVSAEAVCPIPDVDGRLTAELRWDSGTTGRVTCSMIEPKDTPQVLRLDVFGRDGNMLVTNPIAPQFGTSLVVEMSAGTETIDVERSATYDHQLAAFRDAVERGIVPPTTGAEPIANMVVIDECYRAAGLQPRPSIA